MIREATADDVEGAADTLAAAFEDYPFTRHTISADDHMVRLRRFQRIFLAEIGLPYGRVWVSDDLRAVSVWTVPGADSEEGAARTMEALLPRLVELAGDRAPAYASAEAAMEPHRPEGPVWFLGTVGVDPGSRGRGLGRAVIGAGLREADAAGVPAFLETSTEDNVGLYRSLGFRVTAEYELPGGGPRTWSMLRPVGG
ncbi:GNAT family N-acetyltransferase [Nocardiopsis halotolerans]|uniref:GNAT family N-acetyltransferase n=1 Tax=Nocardiopsis halotolerans TaxID=124252 RepID=UPI000344ADA7|nr:GNAT family N-acetyltransferase [Nocardiopsis halotolerans]